MKHPATQCERHGFPPEIIQYAVWLHYRFNLGHRNIEDLLARRGILVTHELIRFWCNKFGAHYAQSHQPTRVRERGMRRFKSMLQVQRFVSVRATVSTLFNLGRHFVAAGHYRTLRQGAFASWDRAVAT
jgi:transposase-like protein